LFSIRGFFLSLITVVFLSLMAVFLYININLRFEKKVILELKGYMQIKEYSEYFENERKNDLYFQSKGG
ncbi:hypothetical protein DPD03_18885, partial [Salmonella enterica subsp. enterica]|nr:hypothetical protein [Salmonella enterica subsp. enterica]